MAETVYSYFDPAVNISVSSLPDFPLLIRSCWAWERPPPGRGLAALRRDSLRRAAEAGRAGLAWAGRGCPG